MIIKDIITHLEKLAPRDYAEDFDNTGLLTGSQDTKVTGILTTLDCLENVVDEAIEKNCNLIVAFHPIIFKGLKHLQPTDYVRIAVVKAIKNDIAIYATHTALDVARGGVSYRMAAQLGLENVKTLIPKKQLIKKLTVYVPAKEVEQVREALFDAGAGALGNYLECSYSTDGNGTFKGNTHSNPQIGQPGIREIVQEHQLQVTFLPHVQSAVMRAMHTSHPYEEVSYEVTTLENAYQDIGMGAIGNMPQAMPVDDFLKHTKSIFNCGVIRTSLSRKREIKKVAVLGGSGAFAVSKAIAAGADAYLTADLKYHDFFMGTETLICDIGHYESEQFTKNLLHEYLSNKFSSFAILCAQAQTNPVNYYY